MVIGYSDNNVLIYNQLSYNLTITTQFGQLRFRLR